MLFGGESRDPDYVAAEIVREADRLRREGIDPESFECARRALYGSAVSGFGSVSLLANRMADAALDAETAVDFLRAHPGNVTLGEVRAAMLGAGKAELPELRETERGLRLIER